MSTSDNTPPGHIPPEQSLIEYPCDFPIKVMGKQHDDFADTIVKVIQEFDPEFHAGRLETRPSSGGNYTGLTANVHATSREQLDAIYKALTGHPMVKIVL